MNLQAAVILVLTAVLLNPAVALTADKTATAGGSQDRTGVDWQSDLKAAALESKRTGKPILMQVTATWCRYCHKMLGETFPDGQLAAKINEYFVPVVLDADEHEEIVAAIDITAFPSTIIISPKLDVIGQIRGFHTARSLENQLSQYCTARARRVTSVKSRGPRTGDSAASAGKRQAAVSAAQISRSPIAAIGPARVQPLVSKTAFDGLCLVSMLQNRKRQSGRSEYSMQYRNLQLQFVSDENLRKFQEQPAQFWPMFDGHCPVAIARGEKDRLGDVDTVAVYRGQLVFFKSLSHRKEFAQNPGACLEKARVQEARDGD